MSTEIEVEAGEISTGDPVHVVAPVRGSKGLAPENPPSDEVIIVVKGECFRNDLKLLEEFEIGFTSGAFEVGVLDVLREFCSDLEFLAVDLCVEGLELVLDKAFDAISKILEDPQAGMVDLSDGEDDVTVFTTLLAIKGGDAQDEFTGIVNEVKAKGIAKKFFKAETYA